MSDQYALGSRGNKWRSAKANVQTAYASTLSENVGAFRSSSFDSAVEGQCPCCLKRGINEPAHQTRQLDLSDLNEGQIGSTNLAEMYLVCPNGAHTNCCHPIGLSRIRFKFKKHGLIELAVSATCMSCHYGGERPEILIVQGSPGELCEVNSKKCCRNPKIKLSSATVTFTLTSTPTEASKANTIAASINRPFSSHLLNHGRRECSYLTTHAEIITRSSGFKPEGILKGSIAAWAMSMEARLHNERGVPKMIDGGLTASLQSIGALGHIKPEAFISLKTALEGLLHRRSSSRHRRSRIGTNAS